MAWGNKTAKRTRRAKKKEFNKTPAQVFRLAIKDIKISEKLPQLDDEQVRRLAQSLAQLGQLCPINVGEIRKESGVVLPLTEGLAEGSPS